MMKPSLKISFFSLILLGCSQPKPIIQAHRGASGYWPQNTKTALSNSLKNGYPSIEFDIAVTRDNIPIIHHDPWINPELCTTAAGEPVPENTLIYQMDWEEISTSYLCGGLPDEDFPDIEPQAEPILTLEEVFQLAADYPEILLNLDIKYIPDYSHPPEIMASAIVEVIEGLSPENPLLANCNRKEFLAAFHQFSDIATSLEWPIFIEFLDGKSDVSTALQHEFLSTIGGVDYLSLLEDSGAVLLSIPYQIIDRRQIEVVRDHGFNVQVWTPNSERLLDNYCNWPVKYILTDYPERASCL